MRRRRDEEREEARRHEEQERGNVKLHVNVSVRRKGNGSWRRLVNRKGWLRDEDSSDESRSCSKKEIVYANWKNNELVRGSNVSVREPERGKWRGEEKLVKASCPKTRRTFLHDLSLPPIPGGHHRGIPT